MEIDCILLAAGFSSRMSQWKLLRDYKGKSIIEQALDNASVYSERIIISGGYRVDELRDHLSERKNIVIVNNPDYAKGMMTSIKAALPYVKTDLFFITLGDLPLISPRIYKEMGETKFDEVLFPVHNGRRGHPVLLKRTLSGIIAKAEDSDKMKSILSKFSISELEVNTSGIFEDIDTDSDYRSLLER